MYIITVSKEAGHLLNRYFRRLFRQRKAVWFPRFYYTNDNRCVVCSFSWAPYIPTRQSARVIAKLIQRIYRRVPTLIRCDVGIELELKIERVDFSIFSKFGRG